MFNKIQYNNMLLLLTLVAILHKTNCSDCVQRKYNETSFICVCNSTYCDSIDPVPNNLESNQYVTYTTTKDNLRMKQNFGENITFQNQQTPDIILNRVKKYQTIIGFGGAMTDAAGINIASLPKAAQDLLMQQYFGDDGIQYTILRIPIGGTDFSTHPYSLYDIANDTQFINFNLAEEDFKYKIPLTKQAIELSKTYPIHLMACPWTAPAYMKTNKDLRALGYLLPEYYQDYANYLTKFLQEYQKQGLNFSIMSAQNEPIFSGVSLTTWNGMAWNSWQQVDFIIDNLVPTFDRNGFDNVQILVGDDQRLFMKNWLHDMLTYKPNVTQYFGGIGIHWYLDYLCTPNDCTDIHEMPGFENKFILYTEACENSFGFRRGATLGTWKNAEKYLESIIDTLNDWNQGWIDWNLAVDLKGGPNWDNNIVNAPIVVNASAEEFYKNPMYYALAHVSKFIVPGSIRIDMITNHDQIKATAFDTPDNRTVFVLMNLYGNQYNLLVQDIERNRYKNLEILPYSFMTVIY